MNRLNSLFVLAATVIVMVQSAVTRNKTALRILGLFPYRGSAWDGEYVIPAARLAIDEINRNDSILPRFELELIEANSGCARDTGVLEFVTNTLHTEHTPVAILGAGCSSSTIPIASIAGRDDVCLPQVSYGATSHFLAFTSSYPYFFRTIFSDGSTSEAVISILDKFNWKRYGVHKIGFDGLNEIWIDHFIYSLRAGIQYYISDAEEVYSSDFNHEGESFEDYIQFIDVNGIRSSGMRIGILYATDRVTAGDFMCYLHRQKLVYPHIIWILIDICHIIIDNSTGKYCTGKEELKQAIQGSICLGYKLTTDSTISVTGNKFDHYFESYTVESRKYATEKGDNYSSSLLNDWATITYDSVWTLGLALHNTEEKLHQCNSSLTDFSLGNCFVSGTIVEELAKINFAGASGEVSFSEERERLLAITFSQIQENGILNIVGLYHPSSNSSRLGNLSINNSALLWSADDPPSDKFPTETVLAQTWAGIVMLVLLVVGFLWTSFSTFINFRYQNFYLIKASSPQLNYMLFAGNNLLLLSGTLLVITAITKLDMVIFSTICQTTQWLFDLGLLLILNITLLKSWRIYRLFYSFKRKPRWLITDIAIIGISVGWILVNTVYHVVFTLVNESNIAEEKFLPKEEDQFSQKFVVYCLPPHLFGLFYIPHFLMAVILCSLAFLIRRVYRKHFNDAKHKHFNDAKNVAIFLYATIPIATICLTMSALLSPANDVYNLVSVSLMLQCTAFLCIVYICQLALFIPKVLPVLKNYYCHR
ncbi:gamma-aminobutyric acid type B receptor subunit 2-like [Dysidea avara]|uniref:gamma-aminobutyric acid type B receptor subunit 2-like n=1 Tax=Dysidea avara TaxID=196820 RepID=UPI00332326B5